MKLSQLALTWLNDSNSVSQVCQHVSNRHVHTCGRCRMAHRTGVSEPFILLSGLSAWPGAWLDCTQSGWLCVSTIGISGALLTRELTIIASKRLKSRTPSSVDA
jgi:hypothetical protein